MALFILLLLFPYVAMGTTIVCDEGKSGNCFEETLYCRNSEECVVHCNSSSACAGAKIDCTGIDYCAVHCSSMASCHTANILCGNKCIINATGTNAVSVATIHVPDDSNSSIICNGDRPCEGTVLRNECMYILYRNLHGNDRKSVNQNVRALIPQQGININVDHNAIANVQCNGYGACDSISINVLNDSAVDLYCQDTRSCTSLKVNASYDSTKLNITCNGTTTTDGLLCDTAKIIGGDNSTIDVSCIDGPYTCLQAQVQGGKNSSINMLCTGKDPKYYADCNSAKVTGQSGSNINVSCTENANCNSMTINGKDAASLSFNNCTGNVTCKMVTVYCPPQINGEKMCILEGGDKLQILDVYAVNSWDDIEFITPLRCQWNKSTMHCDDDYGESCIFGGKESKEIHPDWQCNDHSSSCYVEQGVEAPRCPAPASKDPPLTTVEIVVVVICCVIVLVLLVVLSWWLVKRNGQDKQIRAVPMSDESDTFIQSQPE